MFSDEIVTRRRSKKRAATTTEAESALENKHHLRALSTTVYAALQDKGFERVTDRAFELSKTRIPKSNSVIHRYQSLLTKIPGTAVARGLLRDHMHPLFLRGDRSFRTYGDGSPLSRFTLTYLFSMAALCKILMIRLLASKGKRYNEVCSRSGRNNAIPTLRDNAIDMGYREGGGRALWQEVRYTQGAIVYGKLEQVQLMDHAVVLSVFPSSTATLSISTTCPPTADLG